MRNHTNKKSFPIFFLNHEFVLPALLFFGMLITERVELILSVLGFRFYETDNLVPLLFYAGMTYIAVLYSFRSFMRWSRFRLSQHHPIFNSFLNILIATLPMASIIVTPLLLFPLLVIHWFSHVRSPEPEEAKGHVGFLSRTYVLILSQMALAFAGLMIVSMKVQTLSDLVFWGWLSG